MSLNEAIYAVRASVDNAERALLDFVAKDRVEWGLELIEPNTSAKSRDILVLGEYSISQGEWTLLIDSRICFGKDLGRFLSMFLKTYVLRLATMECCGFNQIAVWDGGKLIQYYENRDGQEKEENMNFKRLYKLVLEDNTFNLPPNADIEEIKYNIFYVFSRFNGYTPFDVINAAGEVWNRVYVKGERGKGNVYECVHKA